MSTLSFHAHPELERRIRLAARRRKVALSSFLKEAVEQALVPPARRGRDLRGIVSGTSRIRPGDKVLSPWNDNLEPWP